MRQLTSHRSNALNEAIEIAVLDGPGHGGACHHYEIRLTAPIKELANTAWPIDFQNGAVQEYGYNGLTQEALLAIVEDRLTCFQAGPFACSENATALSHVQEALAALKARTTSRVARGVEGRNEP